MPSALSRAFIPLPLILLSITGISANTQATNVVVNGTASHTIPSTLWGLMYEASIAVGDGGLYGELLQNRAFQQVTPGTAAALNAWHPVNGAHISVIADTKPLSSALPNALQLSIPSGSSGQIGVGNEGFWGINVNSSWTYQASFFYRFPSALPTSKVTVDVSLVSASGTVFASKTATLSPTAAWTEASFALKPSHSAGNTSNNFTVTVNSAALAGKSINFALFSLFPPTFKDQKNGMRADIAEVDSALSPGKILDMIKLGPSFFRFPGGNNLVSGQTLSTRWQWNNTVGPLTARPGRLGDWSYVNTDGLGLLEYLTWIESMGMQNIMAIWAGYDFAGSLAESSLPPYIEQARQQIEFAVGNTSTTGGALRASLGREKPFVVNFVEVGNEDFFAADTYPYRWPDFVGNLSAAFPGIRFLATTDAWSPILSPTPQSYDVHVYNTPNWFAQNSFYYDSFERNGTTYFEGEYAAISTDPNDIFGSDRFLFPTIGGSTGEAAFMTGLERNSDIVFAASYAPLLGVSDPAEPSNITPNLVAFDAGTVIRSTSYYTQKLFSLNRGDEYLPSTLPNPTGTLFWSVTRRNSPPAFIIKISNTIGTPAPISFSLPSAVESSGTAQVLSGAQNASNTPENPNAVVPQTSTITTSQQFAFTAVPFSVSVLTIPIA
ncbi:glycoside hydrolase [Gloeopeniophorella convolvens]|nr:glycoside hydrolase [Gloeopeniophorella convolvens]